MFMHMCVVRDLFASARAGILGRARARASGQREGSEFLWSCVYDQYVVRVLQADIRVKGA